MSLISIPIGFNFRIMQFTFDIYCNAIYFVFIIMQSYVIPISSLLLFYFILSVFLFYFIHYYIDLYIIIMFLSLFETFFSYQYETKQTTCIVRGESFSRFHFHLCIFLILFYLHIFQFYCNCVYYFYIYTTICYSVLFV